MASFIFRMFRAQSNFLLTLFLDYLCEMLSAFNFPESHHDILMNNKSHKLGSSTRDDEIMFKKINNYSRSYPLVT
ncbi:hypothetical protein PROPEN_00459 [Proteus penneri ATCC 35198]|nr:hypothetical protein PROPEN_00459 [Proteus penneri ATCC 35198]